MQIINIKQSLFKSLKIALHQPFMREKAKDVARQLVQMNSVNDEANDLTVIIREIQNKKGDLYFEVEVEGVWKKEEGRFSEVFFEKEASISKDFVKRTLIYRVYHVDVNNYSTASSHGVFQRGIASATLRWDKSKVIWK